MTVSNNNPGGVATGVLVLTVLTFCFMALAISGNLMGLVSKSRFFGSVYAGGRETILCPWRSFDHPSTQIVRS